MEKKLLEIKEESYKKIAIPNELDALVNESINRANLSNKKKDIRLNKWRSIIAVAAVMGIVFVTGVNTSIGFAQSLSKIPVVGELVRLITFIEVHEKLDVINVNLKMPGVEGLGSKKLENQINNEIKKIVDLKIIDAEERAIEYKKAFVETGGNPDEFHSLSVDIGYELKSITEEVLSFKVYSYETMASAYAETYYYNLDLNNNCKISLFDLLGFDYENLIVESVQEQVEELKKNEQNSFFMDDVRNLRIGEGQPFFINESGKVVIIFNKYEIAPGYMGEIEFIITQK